MKCLIIGGNKMKQEKNIYTKYLEIWDLRQYIILICIIGIAIFSAISITKQLIEIENNSYEIDYQNSDLKQIKVKGEEIINLIKVKSSNLKEIEITNISCKDKQIEGDLELQIYGKNEEVIFADRYRLNDIFNSNKIIINLADVSFKYPEEYKFKFEFSNNSNLQAKVVKADSSLLIKQIFPFKFKELLNIVNISIVIIFIGICIWIVKKEREIVLLFCVIAGIFGGYFLILSPPMNALDEYRHFYRAYDIAQGNLNFKFINKDNKYPGNEIEYHDKYETNAPAAVMPENYHNLRRIGDILPIYRDHIYLNNQQVLIQDYIQLYKDKPSESKHYFSLRATAGYNPIAYLPQVIPIKIGRMLGSAPIVVMNLARMGNFLVWLILSALAIYITPRFKEVFLLVALMPTNIHLATSNSADGFLNGLLIVLIAYILYLKRKKLKIRDKAILIGLTCIIGAIKIPYAIFITLILMIEGEPLKQKIILVLGAIISAVLIYLVWDIIYVTNLKQIYEKFSVIPEESIGMSEYIKYVISQPFSFMDLVLAELKKNIIASNGYIYSMISRVGWGSPVGTYFIAYSYFGVIIMSIKNSYNPKIFKKSDQFIISAVIVLLYLGISFVALTWKPLDIGYIWGIQGRYFIAVMPLIAMLWSGIRQDTEQYEEENILRREKLNLNQTIFILYSVWCLCETIQLMLTRYWIG